MLSACTPFEQPLERAEHEIAGGDTTEHYPAVVSLAVEGGRYSYFSGTVISPRVVLTCAHGFLAPDSASIGIDSGVVMFGPHTRGDDAVPERTVAIEAYRVHPGYTPHYPSDIALVLLAEDANVEPISVNTDDLATMVTPGDPVRILGYGRDQDGVAGRKKTVVRSAREVTPRYLTYDGGDEGTRPGDSGGPHLLERNGETLLVATTIGGSAALDFDMRADVHWATFIEPTLAAWEGPCRRDGVCSVEQCPYPDPDCGPCGLDGVCSPDCDQLDPDCPADDRFRRCESDRNCPTGLCVQAPDDTRLLYCARACDDLASSGCGYGFACLESTRHSDRSQRACFYDGPTPGTQGAGCVFDDQCVSTICHEPDSICAEPCETTADCSAPYACVAGATGSVCARTDAPPASGGGCSVSANNDRRPWGAIALALLLMAGAPRRRRQHLLCRQSPARRLASTE